MRYYVMERNGEYWVTGPGERSVYLVRKATEGGWEIIREAWDPNDEESDPIFSRVNDRTYSTKRGAKIVMGRLLKPLTRQVRY